MRVILKTRAHTLISRKYYASTRYIKTEKPQRGGRMGNVKGRGTDKVYSQLHDAEDTKARES